MLSMKRDEFLSELERLLSGLPQQEQEETMQYYRDYFDDAGPEHETEALRELGSPRKVAAAVMVQFEEEDGEFTEKGFANPRWEEPPKEVTPEPEPKPTEPVEEVPEPEPEKKDSPLLSLLLIGAVVLAGGGIGYYFKIYKPKHEAPDLEDDYCEYEDGELEEIAEEPEDEDTPPWEEDTEE